MNKMSINKSNVRSLAAAIVAALILPSCVNLDENQGEGVGYLELPGLTADVEVYELVPTKSGTTTLSELGVTGYNAPDIAAITFNLTGPESYSNTWSGALTEALELPVGTYTLSGEYNNAGNDGLDEALYGDFTTQVTISSQGTVTPEIKLPLANSLVAVSMAEGFDEHFTPAGDDCVTFTSGNASVSAAVGEYVFVPASSELTVYELTVSVKGTDFAGVSKVLTYEELTSPAAKTAYNIVCGLTTTEKAPSVTLASDLSAGAFEDVLYFPAATVANISDTNAAKLKYEIKGGDDSDWTTVTVEDTTANGETYKYITGLTPGATYSLRARVGNIFSEGVSFTQVDYDDCVSVVASAGHTKDGNGDLNGTKVTASVSVTNLPSIIKELATVTATEGTFKNSAETTRSTAAVTTLSKDGQTSLEMQNPDGWPYIPHGENHTMTVNATCKIGEKTYTTTSSKGGITVPEPEFEVFLNAYTSYDLYAGKNGNSKNVTKANEVSSAETLYGISGGVTISTQLIDNVNYGIKTFFIQLDGSDLKRFSGEKLGANAVSLGDKAGLTWAEHTLVASMTFDGKTVTKINKHHITGLPYKPQTMVQDDWNLSSWNCEYVDGIIQLGGVSGSGDCTATSKMAFNVPNTINIVIKTNATVRAHDMRTNIFGSLVGVCNQTTFTVSVNESTIISQYSDYQDNGNTGKNYDLSGNSSFSTDSYSIKMNSSYEMAGPWSKVHSLHILYR